MTTWVTFIIPVRHQANAKDWGRLKANLTQTIASIQAQSHPNWRAVIVANEGADLPNMPQHFEVVRVDFPPNTMHEQKGDDKEAFYDSFRMDKGRRVLKGMLHVPDTKFYMIVDDDDFVSRELVQFAAQNPDANGWKIDKGFIWGDGGNLLFKHDDFANFCGTSLIIRADLYSLPENFEAASSEYIKTMLGSHIQIAKILASQGTPLASLPFRGAVYRIGHAGAHSKSPKIMKMYFFNKFHLIRPHLFVSNLLKLRFIGASKKREYFGTN